MDLIRSGMDVSEQALAQPPPLPLPSSSPLRAVASSFKVGQKVQRRDNGKEWAMGYVTGLDPLKVTVHEDPQLKEGFSWDEVQALDFPPEPSTSLATAEQQMQAASNMMQVVASDALANKYSLCTGDSSVACLPQLPGVLPDPEASNASVAALRTSSGGLRTSIASASPRSPMSRKKGRVSMLAGVCVRSMQEAKVADEVHPMQSPHHASPHHEVSAEEAENHQIQHWLPFRFRLEYLSEQERSHDYSNADMQEAVYWYEMLETRQRLLEEDLLAAKSTKEALLQEQLSQTIHKNLNIIDVHEEWTQLKEDKAAVKAEIHILFEEFKKGKVGYSKFRFDKGGQREVLLVPKNQSVMPNQVKEMLAEWKLEPPDKLVKFDFGMRHYTSLTTKALREMKCFQALMEAADVVKVQRIAPHTLSGRPLSSKSNMSLGDSLGRPSLTAEDTFQGCQVHHGEFGKTEDARSQTKKENMLDDVLKDSILDVMHAVLQAAFMSSSWCLLDRRRTANISSTADLMLESSAQSLRKPPTILVLDSLSRFDEFKPSREVIKQLIQLGDIVALGREREDWHNAGNVPVRKVDRSYFPDAFSRWQKFHYHKRERGRRTEASDQFPYQEEADEREEGNMRLPKTPSEDMIAVDANGDKVETSDGRPWVTAQNKWAFHYQQYLFQEGSHYVLFEDERTSSLALRTHGNVDWPEARIFAHGASLSFHRIQEAFMQGIPSVLLRNTGGVTQTFSKLYRLCVTHKDLLKFYDNPAKVILETLLHDIVSSEPWTNWIGPSTVSMMQRLETRAPEKMRRSIVIVDVLKDTCESIVEKVTSCFASGGVGFPELGLGSAEHDVILFTWHAAKVFDRAAQVFRWRGDLIYYVSLALGVITGFLAIMILRYPEWMQEHEYYIELGVLGFHISAFRFADVALLVLPIISALLTGLVSKKRYLHKWAVLHSTSRQMVAEIYYFRTKVGDYSDIKKEAVVDEDEGDGDKSVNSARDLFVERFREMYSFAMSNVGEDCIKDTSFLNLADVVERQKFQQRLDKFVRERILGRRRRILEKQTSRCRCSCKRKRDAPSRFQCCLSLLDCLCCRRSRENRSTPSLEDAEMLRNSSMTSSSAGDRRKWLSQGIVAGKGMGANFMKDLGQLARFGADDSDSDDNENKVVDDDYVSPMTIDTYMEHRLKPMIRISKKKTPKLASTLSRYETLVMVMNSVATLLAAVDLKAWVALMVILITVVSNLSQYQMVQHRLASHNGVVRDLEGMHTFLVGQSVVQRRTQKMKAVCVDMTEKAVLETVQAWTGLSPISYRASSGGDGDENDKDGRDKSKKVE